jgi:hypothetical protein
MTQVIVVCKVCKLRTPVIDPQEAEAHQRNHNEMQHDGHPVATITNTRRKTNVAHPAQQMNKLMTGSGLLAYLEAVRRNELEAYDALMEAAQIVRVGIRRSGGRGWALGLDVRLLARRITRPIEHAADLHMEAAKALATSALIFRQTLELRVVKTAANTFNPGA